MSGADDLQKLGRRILEQQDGSAEREEYLLELERRVRSGSYQVDATELAARLLEHLELDGLSTGESEIPFREPGDPHPPEPTR